MRILGLDVGEKRIGVAVSDPSGKTARGLDVIARSDDDTAMVAIVKMIEELEIGKIVIGMPLTMKGDMGPQAERTRTFAGKLESGIDIPVVTYDERLSTIEAGRVLKDAGIRPSRRRGLKDLVAAAVILQAYLDGQVNGSSRDR